MPSRHPALPLRVFRTRPAEFLVVLLCLASLGCGERPRSPLAGDPTLPQTTAPNDSQPAAASRRELTLEERPGLHNLIRISNRVYSGSQPHGDEGFESLSQLGIETIVSVDGARPDVDRSRAGNLRYVHIPIGYDGVSKSAAESLAQVMRETKGLVYIHCHHGKHRGPAAAAIACLAAHEVDSAAALQILRTAGTSPDYAGLWRDVENFQPPAADQSLPELVEVAEVDSLVTAMVALDQHFDHLKLCRKAGWQTPADHSDLTPVQTATLVQEALQETARTVNLEQHPAELRPLLEEAASLSANLMAAIKSGESADDLELKFRAIETSCKSCHTKFRDQSGLR